MYGERVSEPSVRVLPKKQVPKTKCCVSSTRCGRCPLRMMAEDRLPEGYTVKKRRLVKVGPDVPDLVALPKPGKKKGKKGKKARKAAALAA